MANPRHQLGRNAERAVARWLASRGWEILAVRWRGSGGELDLVCAESRVLVGVEVKLRRSGRAGSGAESVSPARLHRLRRTLAEYRALNGGHWGAVRVDLAEITPVGGGRWRLVHTRGIDAW